MILLGLGMALLDFYLESTEPLRCSDSSVRVGKFQPLLLQVASGISLLNLSVSPILKMLVSLGL